MIPVELCHRKSTADAIFVVRQMQEKCCEQIYFCGLPGLEKQLTVPLENLYSES